VVGHLRGVTSERPGGLKNTNSSALEMFWLLRVTLSMVLTSGGLKLFGGLMHFITVYD
jgi:hypothetical protein